MIEQTPLMTVLLRCAWSSATLLLSTSAWCLLSVSITVYQGQAPCGQARGAMRANPAGGVTPYAVQWSNGAITNTIYDLPAGTYTVTVTDGAGTVEQASADVTYVNAYPQLFPVVTMTSCIYGSGYAIFPVSDAGGLYPIAPATFTGFGVVGQSISQDGNWYVIEITDPPGQTVINYTDALGCPGSFTWNILDPVELPEITVSGISGSCSDGSTGGANISIPAVPGENDLFFTLKRSNGDPIYETPCMGEQGGGFSGVNMPLSTLAPGDYWAVLDVDEYCLFGVLPSFIGTCADSVMFSIPDLGVTCGTVAGTSWYDVDGDCVLDPEDVGVPYSTLIVQPGSNAVLTGADGAFQFELVDGPYTLGLADASLVPICPLDQPVPFVVNDDETIIDLASSSIEQLDLVLCASGGPARPGFTHSFHGVVRNVTPQVSGPVTITMTIDSDVDYLEAVPTPTSVTGNILTWNLPSFGLFAQGSFNVTMSVPLGTAVGTEVLHTVSVSNTLPESTVANNVVNWSVNVSASFDPNDKVARTSSGRSNSLYFLDADEYIDYTIRFQNTGNDTAFAVVVTDTLDAALDMLSYQQGAASHPFDVRFKAGRVVEWRFADILLPDSTTNEAASHGLLTFRIKPQVPIVAGTTIANSANIYFDLNEPVITEPSLLTAEFSTASFSNSADPMLQLLVMPNPAAETVHVRAGEGSIRQLVMSSTDGRVVWQGTVRDRNATIDLRNVAGGTYVIQAMAEDGRILRTKLTKN